MRNENRAGIDDPSLFKIGFFFGLGFLAANFATVIFVLVLIYLFATGGH